jgi:beta-fructofuranosidase
MQPDDATNLSHRAADDQPAGPDSRISDTQRPRYHFMPPANWMNDPNGLIHWRGAYHLFYQYNPHGPFWGTIQWGHAVSTDLVHWTHLPVALAPTPGSYDGDGCFSGCAVDQDGVPTIIYTGVQDTQQRPCIATSSDNLRTWRKYPGNPVIAGPPAGLDVLGFRDHSVWREGDTWYQVIGSGIRGQGGAALLYRSPDLLQWEYLHPLFVGDRNQTQPIWTGGMWECPDFFALGDRHVLIVSVWDDERLYYPVYFTGAYTNHHFTPDSAQRLDFGASFYAPQSMRDAQGRRIMWGWLREERDSAAQLAAGWSGVMSLPRIVALRPDGTLDIRPAPELALLRGAHHRLQDRRLTPEAPADLAEVRGDTLEIVAEFALGEATEVGVVLRRAPQQEEQTGVYYDRRTQQVVVDGSRSSLSAAATRVVAGGPLAVAQGETVRLHIFLDRSVVEVFANEQTCITERIYPTRPDSLGLALLVRGGTAHLTALDVWELESI